MRTDSIITSDRPLPSIGVVCSVAVLAVAILGAVSSLVVNGIRSNHITLVETQQAVSEAHLSRARSCMDMAATGIDDPDLLERARLQVNMSNGIVLCLVRNRENAVLDIASAARCVRDLEIENQLAVEDAHGMISTVPPC